jgi:hypothetical protein
MNFGKAFAKSFAGETTFAAMFTASVATITVNIEIATTTWLRELSDELHRIPEIRRRHLRKNDRGGRSNDHAHRRKQCHRRRQSDDLPKACSR